MTKCNLEKNIAEHGPTKTMELLLDYVSRTNASDLHLLAGASPRFRIGVDLIPHPEIDFEPISGERVVSLAYSVLTDRQKKIYEESKELDFSYKVGNSNFRINLGKSGNSLGLTARRIPEKILEIRDIGFPTDVWRDIVSLKRGLVLITGPTGSGKSTTLASIMQEINRNQYSKIVTIEDPIEFIHPNIKSSIYQREVGRDTESFYSGVKQSLRQDPDIILIGEVRGPDTAACALTAAETGHLVLATLHNSSATDTVERYVDEFPIEVRDSIRSKLANNLYAVVCQELLPHERTAQKIVTMEVMVPNPAIRNHIRKGENQKITDAIRAGRKEKMITMDDHFFEHWLQGRLPREVVLEYAHRPAALEDRIAFAERNDKEGRGK